MNEPLEKEEPPSGFQPGEIGKSAACVASPHDVAIVGLGNQGAEHVRALRETRLPLRLAAAVDPAGVRDEIDLPVGCRAFKTIDKIPASVGAVIVATPPMTYRAIVPKLLADGRHLLLEKPLGIDLKEALEFVELARRARRVLMPAVQRRFHPTYRAWPEWRLLIGREREALIYMAIRHRGEAWRASRAEAGGGALFDLGFHAIDLAQQLFGDLRLRSCCFFDEAGRPCHDGFDFESDLLLHSESDVAVRVHVVRGAPEKEERVVVRGDTGTVEIDRSRLELAGAEGRSVKVEADPAWTIAMEAQMHLWLQAITAMAFGHAAEASAWNGASAMRMMEEAYAWGRC